MGQADGDGRLRAAELGGVSLDREGASKSKYGLASQMRVEGATEGILLPRGQVTKLPILIDNSTDLAPGGHYGAALVGLSDATQSSGSNVSVRQELVSLFFVKKQGGEQYGLDLQDLAVDNPRALPDKVTMRFANTGNVHVVPRGYVEVTDPGGKLIAKGIINPESTLVMPESTRQFVSLLQPVASSNVPGVYRVTAYYRYDGQEKFSSRSIEISRWSMIYAPVLAAGASTTILCLVLWKTRKKRRRRLSESDKNH